MQGVGRKRSISECLSERLLRTPAMFSLVPQYPPIFAAIGPFRDLFHVPVHHSPGISAATCTSSMFSRNGIGEDQSNRFESSGCWPDNKAGSCLKGRSRGRSPWIPQQRGHLRGESLHVSRNMLRFVRGQEPTNMRWFGSSDLNSNFWVHD